MSTTPLNMRLRGARLAALAAGLSTLSGVQAALPDGISGAWYNPAQEGHGLSIALVDQGRRAVVVWHVFDPAGTPLTLYVDGRVAGRDIVGPAYAPRGMRFAAFDPATLDLPRWGEVTLHFDDCGNATLRWDAQAEAYPDGSMAIVPLARPQAVPCSLPPDVGVLPGLYGASAMVDREGRLWAASAPNYQPPSTDARAEVAIAEVTAVDGGTPSMTLLYGPAGGARLDLLEGGVVAGNPYELRFPTNSRVAFPPPPNGIFPTVPGPRPPIRGWQFGTRPGTVLQAPVDLARLAGAYRLPYVVNANDARSGQIDIAADGALCARYRPAEQGRCDVTGRVSTPEGVHGLIDVAIADPQVAGEVAYRGRGWLVEVEGRQQLYLVGTDGESGFLLYGER